MSRGKSKAKFRWCPNCRSWWKGHGWVRKERTAKILYCSSKCMLEGGGASGTSRNS